jgi:hypothetical protein
MSQSNVLGEEQYGATGKIVTKDARGGTEWAGGGGLAPAVLAQQRRLIQALDTTTARARRVQGEERPPKGAAARVAQLMA